MTKLTLIDSEQPNNYDCRVSIDTMYLTAKLDDEQKEFIYDRFKFDKNKPKYHWRYRQNDTRNLGFSLYAVPNNPYTNKHYNHVIQLQKEVTTADYIPYSLNEIINNMDWNIKRLDLAYDFKTSPEKSLIMKHHGNLQFDTNNKWNTDYLGKLTSRSPSKVAFYNRNNKEQERKSNIIHEYSNRYEIRLFPASNDEAMKLHNMQDDFILKHLRKYIIIPNIDDLPISKWDKNRLYRIKDNHDYLKTLNKKKQKELKAITKAFRIPLERIYLENKHNLFRFKETSYNELKQAQ